MRNAVDKLAKRDHMPSATKAERLLEIALELEEDQVWEEIATQRASKKNARFISHEEAWPSIDV